VHFQDLLRSRGISLLLLKAPAGALQPLPEGSLQLFRRGVPVERINRFSAFAQQNVAAADFFQNSSRPAISSYNRDWARISFAVPLRYATACSARNTLRPEYKARFPDQFILPTPWCSPARIFLGFLVHIRFHCRSDVECLLEVRQLKTIGPLLRCRCLRRHTVVEFCDRQFEDSL
jgi:hypothetical protein